NARGRVCHSGAAYVHSIESSPLHLSRHRRVRHSRQHHCAFGNQLTQSLALTHAPALTLPNGEARMTNDESAPSHSERHRGPSWRNLSGNSTGSFDFAQDDNAVRASSFLLRHRRLSFVISNACINTSTFFASSNFQAISIIFFARSLPITGSTSMRNFPSTAESFSRFLAWPSG